MQSNTETRGTIIKNAPDILVNQLNAPFLDKDIQERALTELVRL